MALGEDGTQKEYRGEPIKVSNDAKKQTKNDGGCC